MSHSQWQALSSKEYQLLGDIDRDSVPAIWRILEKWQTTESNVEIDLSHINRVDSAGMVMLIHLLEHAKNQNCHIMLSFVPEQLRTLFQLSNIQPMMAEHIKN
ncbi:STAS domain-containing protein [Vibrio splendidus]|uniref:STAS domain-containing protein n=1 Tax=Vibrio splendidus TaxID=29497 RepID=UPI0007F95E7F|nr:lipid asymmetry maintenance protein MlaB [Vibrio splendidus]OBT23850.1 NTP-binding protein [Vibrio splendidus]